jgi:pyruvate carboxylase
MAGNKVTAKEHAISAGVPVLASSEATTDIDQLIAFADSIGYPVFAKAVAGGGGRGMRRVGVRARIALVRVDVYNGHTPRH